MANDDPYSRLYWRLVDDPKFADIYSDDRHFATWTRLLMLADMAWPASAHLPAFARKGSVAKLAEVRLIDLLPGGRFRVHGLDPERKKRQDHARYAAAYRWQDGSNASGNPARNAPSIPASIAQAMPRQDETRKDETSRARRPRSFEDIAAEMAAKALR